MCPCDCAIYILSLPWVCRTIENLPQHRKTINEPGSVMQMTARSASVPCYENGSNLLSSIHGCQFLYGKKPIGLLFSLECRCFAKAVGQHNRLAVADAKADNCIFPFSKSRCCLSFLQQVYRQCPQPRCTSLENRLMPTFFCQNQ